MTSNTLYYAFSTIPQVLAAVVAVLAVFVPFRITRLQDYLVGDGLSVLNRAGSPGYRFPDQGTHSTQIQRLEDAVQRKSIHEIKNVIFQLYEIEQGEGITKEDRPLGIWYLYEERFLKTENHINMIKRGTKIVVAVSFSAIVISILSVLGTEYLIMPVYEPLRGVVLWLNILLFIISLFFALRLIYLGLSDGDVLHEADRSVEAARAKAKTGSQ